MLSGRAPFYSRAKTDSASSIMRRIKEGDFRLEGDAWRYVSSAARNLTKGLLTVDPRKRFSMEQLCSSPWLAAASSQSPASQPCLLTASLLIAAPTERCTRCARDALPRCGTRSAQAPRRPRLGRRLGRRIGSAVDWPSAARSGERREGPGRGSRCPPTPCKKRSSGKEVRASTSSPHRPWVR